MRRPRGRRDTHRWWRRYRHSMRSFRQGPGGLQQRWRCCSTDIQCTHDASLHENSARTLKRARRQQS